MGKIKSWIKELVREVLREEIKEVPLIISSRAPFFDDVYTKGTRWKTPQEEYVLKEVVAHWKKIDKQ